MSLERPGTDPSVPKPGPRRVLVLSQVYVPDPASVGQHLAELATELTRRGSAVTVISADRGYEDPSLRYPRRETLHGVNVVRLPLSSFGKSSISTRLAAQGSFLAQSLVRVVAGKPFDVVLVSTSPPMAGAAAGLLNAIRGTPFVYWAMDLNPDQLVALGAVTADSPSVRAFDSANRFMLRRAARVVTLDRFMAARLAAKAPIEPKTHVIPPWAHDLGGEPLPHATNSFRREHGFGGRFVVMYSGNHAISSPLDTLLNTAFALRDDSTFLFVFIGGGHRKTEVTDYVRRHRLENVVQLPYQPFHRLRESLSSADIHVVSLGDAFVGVVHPCKIYGAMAHARPILFFGPKPSHASEILEASQAGWHIRHGDVDGAVTALRAAKRSSELAVIGLRAQRFLRANFSTRRLLGELCDLVENVR